MAPLHLPADLRSAGVARRWLTDGWAGHDVTDAVDFAAQLLTSELVTNAVIHARSPVTLTLQLTAQTLRIEVSDDDPRQPRARDAHDAEVGGRGLQIVDRLAASWGVVDDDVGKTVWFELAR